MIFHNVCVCVFQSIEPHMHGRRHLRRDRQTKKRLSTYLIPNIPTSFETPPSTPCSDHICVSDMSLPNNLPTHSHIKQKYPQSEIDVTVTVRRSFPTMLLTYIPLSITTWRAWLTRNLSVNRSFVYETPLGDHGMGRNGTLVDFRCAGGMLPTFHVY